MQNLTPAMATVLAALIGAVSAIVVNLINNWQASKKRAVEEALKEERLQSRLRSIETKLDTHNGYAEKIGGIQKDINRITTDIAVMSTEIKNLDRKGE